MLEIDREATTSVRDHLAEQLRYLIARGQYRVNDTLPSTRKLADQLGISFHTVRKAYQQLEADGLLTSKVGSGYTVKERTPLDKSERMERGAEVVHDALQRLIGFGLTETEIESLFQEQTALLDHLSVQRKLVLTGPCAEMNEMCAEQVGHALQQPVRAVHIEHLNRHEDADFVFAPFEELGAAMQAVPRADTIGFGTHLPAGILSRVSRLMEHQTLGLITRENDTIGPLSTQLRRGSAYSGQVVAASIQENRSADHLESFIGDTDVLLYTPKTRRRLLPLLGEEVAHAEVRVVVTRDSLSAIQDAVPA